MKLSIIIPVYNVEQYICQCIDSLLNVGQHEEEIEIIIIDDGSSDGSAAICKEYSEKYGWVKYFFQDNSGVSVARNKGIQLSKGQYITFIDADDYVDKKYYEVILNSLSDLNTQLVVFGYETSNISLRREIVSSIRKIEIETGSYEDKQYLYYNIGSTVWNKVFKRNIIVDNDLQFDSAMNTGEDRVFIIEYLSYIDNVVFLPEKIYYYRYNCNSAIHKLDLSYFKNFKHTYEMEKSLILMLGLGEKENLHSDICFIEKIMSHESSYYLKGVKKESISNEIDRCGIKKTLNNIHKLPILYQIKKFLIKTNSFSIMVFYHAMRNVKNKHYI